MAADVIRQLLCPLFRESLCTAPSSEGINIMPLLSRPAPQKQGRCIQNQFAFLILMPVWPVHYLLPYAQLTQHDELWSSPDRAEFSCRIKAYAPPHGGRGRSTD